MTTVLFGEAFYASLIDGVVLDSMPSLKAMTAVQSENRNPFIYLEAINKATFMEGRKHDLDLFNQLALKYYEDDTFEERFNSPQLTEATYAAINLGKTLGATSYPTVYLEQDNQRFEYPLDYSSYDKLKNWIMEHLVL
jgi:protein-disulfide isomerase-like protein with CxxC motif